MVIMGFNAIVDHIAIHVPSIGTLVHPYIEINNVLNINQVDIPS